MRTIYRSSAAWRRRPVTGCRTGCCAAAAMPRSRQRTAALCQTRQLQCTSDNWNGLNCNRLNQQTESTDWINRLNQQTECNRLRCSLQFVCPLLLAFAIYLVRSACICDIFIHPILLTCAVYLSDPAYFTGKEIRSPAIVYLRSPHERIDKRE